MSEDFLQKLVRKIGNTLNVLNQQVEDNWSMYQGDSVEVIKGISDESIHYSVFSPPFAELYTYSNSDRDMGNSKDYNEFFNHFEYLVKELFRVTKSGRLLSFHCIDIPMMKEKHGVIGLMDFPGDLIRLFKKVGWIYHSRVVIWKDPLIEATRTKSLGLMHKQLCKDSSMSRQGGADYVITVRKPGVNSEVIKHDRGFERYVGEDDAPDLKLRNKETGKNKYSHLIWQRYASPVWLDIRQSNTLQRTSVREEKDEKHICPLQLQVIERCIELWTNSGDIVLDPFSGIGSTGYVSLQQGRKFVGVELKEVYYKQSCANLSKVVKNKGFNFKRVKI